MIASMTWQQQQHPLSLCLTPLYAPARLTATNISDIIYHQPACQSSHWVKKKKYYRPVKASCETTEDSDDSPPPLPLLTTPRTRTRLRLWPTLCCSALSLGCAVKKLLCLLILPMRAAVPSPSAPLLPLTLPFPVDQCRVGGKLHNKKLCLPFASNASGRAPALLQPLTVRVCVSLKTYFASFIWQ